MTQQPIGNPEAPYAPKDELAVGDIYHLPTGVKVTAEQMNAAISDARIIYVGETHDNPAAHRVELQVLKAVAARYPNQVSLGLEMFNPGQQEVLDRWVAGELDEKTFLKEVNWFSNWKMDFAYYSDLLHFAREAQIPIIGLNATRDTVKAVGRYSLDELDAETRRKLPEFDLQDPYQTAMVDAIYADHSQGKAMLDGFLRIQTLWDETMAENIVKTLEGKAEDHRMVVMAGGNHVRFGFGIPRRVYRRLPTSYTLVGSRELVIPEEKQDRLMDVDLPRFPMPPYDYIVYTEYESLPGGKVKLGVRMTDESGRVIVEAVVPGSTAADAGVLEGDIIVEIDEAVINESFDLVYEINQRNSGDQAKLVVERGGEQIELDLTFMPMPVMKKQGMGSQQQ
jgi:uncharacterized iron-regulated protein